MNLMCNEFNKIFLKAKRLMLACISITISTTFFLATTSFAQNDSDVKTLVDSVDKAKNGMTLWETIQSGGWVMMVLGLLSIGMIALIVFLFIKLNPQKLVPIDSSQDLIVKLSDGKKGLVRELCAKQDNLMSKVVLAGLDKAVISSQAMREAIELRAKKEISTLWQWVGYLSDIAAIAPMVGLLGTVIGMIQAFNTIAFQSAVVKPILLAGGVSKAMVTTAGGMIIAIIAMSFYSFFRAKAQDTTNLLETFVNDALHLKPKVTKHKTGAAS